MDRAEKIAREVVDKARELNDDGDFAMMWVDAESMVASALRSYVPEWLPIETAPKDGTPCDFWNTMGWRIPDVTWNHHHQAFGVWATPENNDDGPYFVKIAMLGVTHWRPLPAPPSQTVRASLTEDHNG